MSEEKFENIDQFCSLCCEHCNNDWYCPVECELLEKARKMPLEKINAKWIEHEGDIRKIVRYIKQYKFRYRSKK